MVLYAFTVVVVLIICNNGQSNTTNTTKNEPKVDLFVAQYLETAMNNQLNITTKYCTWNVSLIVKLINDTNPQFFFEPQNVVALPQFLPPYIIQQLPQELLDFYGLNFSNTSISECGHDTNLNVTSAPFNIDVCIGPLIHSNNDNPLKEEQGHTLNLKNLTGFEYFLNVSLSKCGLACSSGHQIFGLSQNEQNAVDIFKIIGCALCFIAMVVLAVTQYLDLKRKDEKFFEKPLLQMIPYVLTLAGFGIVLSMALGEIIGKEEILCSNNNNSDEYNEEKLEYSFYNPFKGKNAACTIHGLFFYSFVQLYEYYTVLLSFVIFRQVYAPLKPLWDIKDRYWHMFIFSFILIFDIISISINSFAGVYPMSVCFPGLADKYELLGLFLIPCLISLLLSIICISCSAYLLREQLIRQRKSTNLESTIKMQDLVQRYCLYAIGELCALILLNMTGFAFYLEMDIMEQQMKDSIQCEIEQILLNPNKICQREHSMSSFWFMSWIICSIFAIFAQVILTCHSDHRDRFKEKISTITILSKEKSKTHSLNSPTTPNSPSPKPNSINNSINIELTHADIGSVQTNAIVSLQSDDDNDNDNDEQNKTNVIDSDGEGNEYNNNTHIQSSDYVHTIGSIVVGTNMYVNDGLHSNEHFIMDHIIDDQTNDESVHL
eukprot:190397_1